jgi:hypothetical protein
MPHSTLPSADQVPAADPTSAATSPVSPASSSASSTSSSNRRTSQHSHFAKTLLMTQTAQADLLRRSANAIPSAASISDTHKQLPVQPPTSTPVTARDTALEILDSKPAVPASRPLPDHRKLLLSKDSGGVGPALSDTPLPSAATSPKL